MQYRKMLVVASLALALLLGIHGAAGAQAAGDDEDQYMMGPGMMGPGMMGQGMMGQGCGTGPEMMGQRYGMGPGMMYRGYGMGPGMMVPGYRMGPGMMGPGYGMGPGMMYRGYGMRVTPTFNLTVDDVMNYFTGWLESQGNKRLRVGKVEAKDKNTITADIETVDGSLVQRLEVDRHSGLFHPAEQ